MAQAARPKKRPNATRTRARRWGQAAERGRVDFSFGPEDEELRDEARAWLDEHSSARTRAASGRRRTRQPSTTGGPAHAARAGSASSVRPAGSGSAGTGPRDYGQPAATLTQQVVWAEEYARAAAPARVGHIGENLLAPTLIAFGDPGPARPLPAPHRPRRGAVVPGVQRTRCRLRPRRRPHGAVRDRADGTYRVTGQKIWTSLAQRRRLVLRPRPHRAGVTAPPRALLPARADGPAGPDRGPADPPDDRRPREFNEVFFDGALADAEHLVGGQGNGWQRGHGPARRGARGVHPRPADRLRRRSWTGSCALAVRDRSRGGPGPAGPAGTASGPSCAPCAGTPCAPSAPPGQPAPPTPTPPVPLPTPAPTGRRTTPGRPAWPSCCGAAGTSGSASWPMQVRGAAAAARSGATGRRRRPYELDAAAAPVPLLPRRHHLRRLGRDPAQHHRRAGARPAEGTPMTTTNTALDRRRLAGPGAGHYAVVNPATEETVGRAPEATTPMSTPPCAPRAPRTRLVAHRAPGARRPCSTASPTC